MPDHLHATAALAETMAAGLGLSRSAHLAGLFHDLGKYHPDFPRRLSGEAITVPHSTAGAAVLLERAGARDKGAAELIAYCILGHHAGLPDKLNETDGCLTARIEQFRNALDPVWQEDVGAEWAGVGAELLARARKKHAAFDLSVAVRMLFSCLVDADFRDTEAFYAALEGRRAERDWPSLRERLPDFTAAFDAHIASLDRDGELNRLRRDILADVRGKAAMAPGLFTLTVPTGGGKTLASLGFALDHARAHGKARIIYAIPFTSIIDQTAAIFREILGADAVLEHHSSIHEERAGAQGKGKLRLAMEDWAAPVVVTTNVQFFESLFAARPSRVRKLHNIAGSVIILDEAQTIPRPLLLPCVRMLDTLAALYGCTIVLCTATQPALDMRDLAGGLPLEGRELAPDPKGLAARLRRATVVRGGAMDNAALVAVLREAPQALVVVNSRRHALELWRDAAGLDGLFHLTTRQYAAHRREILKEVRAELAAGRPCRVVATSLIEAGVDISFPKVWRAEAGLDQIVQAAGRCNREGRAPVADSVATVFTAPDYPPPAEIRGLIGDMGRMADRHADLLSLEAMAEYFAEVYWRIGNGLDGKRVLPRLCIARSGTDFAFRSIAEDFRLMENAMVPVIVARDRDAEATVGRLSARDVSSGTIARALQPFVVQVPERARGLLLACGHVRFVRPDLRGEQFAVLQTASLYHEETGLWWEDAEYLATEQSMV